MEDGKNIKYEWSDVKALGVHVLTSFMLTFTSAASLLAIAQATWFKSWQEERLALAALIAMEFGVAVWSIVWWRSIAKRLNSAKLGLNWFEVVKVFLFLFAIEMPLLWALAGSWEISRLPRAVCIIILTCSVQICVEFIGVAIRYRRHQMHGVLTFFEFCNLQARDEQKKEER